VRNAASFLGIVVPAREYYPVSIRKLLPAVIAVIMETSKITTLSAFGSKISYTSRYTIEGDSVRANPRGICESIANRTRFGKEVKNIFHILLLFLSGVDEKRVFQAVLVRTSREGIFLDKFPCGREEKRKVRRDRYVIIRIHPSFFSSLNQRFKERRFSPATQMSLSFKEEENGQAVLPYVRFKPGKLGIRHYTSTTVDCVNNIVQEHMMFRGTGGGEKGQNSPAHETDKAP
jgi:hypothetical protein